MLNSKDSVNIYLKDISKIPLLTNEEEYILAKKICMLRKKKEDLINKLTKKESKECREMLDEDITDYNTHKNKMVRANCRLVVSIAKRYTDNFSTLLDCIGEGNIGLLKAVESFDPERGVKFSTHAYFWILQQINHAIQYKSKMIYVPKIRVLKTNIHKNLSKKINKKQFLNFSNSENSVISIDTIIDDSNNTIGDLLKDTKEQYSPLSQSIQKSFGDSINEILYQLTEKERNIICMSYGLNGSIKMSLREIGIIVGISAERVRQILRFTLKKLQIIANKNGLKQFIKE
jgi:RNA polymerase nonessential primary-like sigma factor